MKLESMINLVLVAVLGYTVGKYTQKKKTEIELKVLYSELKKEASKPRKVNYTPYHPKKKSYSTEEPLSFLFPSRKEAEEVLEASVDILVKYGRLSVADIYDIVGVAPSFCDNNYGWKGAAGISIRECNVNMFKHGTYILEYPKAERLD